MRHGAIAMTLDAYSYVLPSMQQDSVRFYPSVMRQLREAREDGGRTATS